MLSPTVFSLAPLHRQAIQASSVDDLPDAVKYFVVKTESALVQHSLALTYSSFTYDEVLQRYLPQGIDVPSSFETIGHVAHLNLREHHMPHRLRVPCSTGRATDPAKSNQRKCPRCTHS